GVCVTRPPGRCLLSGGGDSSPPSPQTPRASRQFRPTHPAVEARAGKELVMATVRDILATKGPHVQSIGPDATVLDAALLMNEHKIGSLVVTDGGQLAGIITERDILRRVVPQRRDPAELLVRDVMTAEVVCCQTCTSLDEAR